jgi:multicomponent Na+:H+ antiporter subunit F
MSLFFDGILVFFIAILPFFLFRVVKGPTVFDRLIGLSGITTKSILLLALIGLHFNQLGMYLDLCLGFGLLNLVGTLAVGKYLEKKGSYE